MIYGLYALGIASRLDELMRLGEEARGTKQKLTDEQRAFVYDSMKYVGTLLIVLIVLFVLAAWDIQAIRLYGIRHRQRIRDDRRAMLERQLPLLYAERRAKRRGESGGGIDAP
jgi:hypothetical protein